MGYLLVNDVHLSDRPPSSCTESYNDDLFDLLDQVAALAQAHHAPAIVLAGDVIHHKTPTRTSHATIRRLIQWGQRCTSQGHPVHVVLGNHDLLHDRIDSVQETQPLGVALASGALSLLDGWADLPDPVYGLPWQPVWDQPALDRGCAGWHSRMRDDDAPALMVTHAPLYPPGRELPYENIPATWWAQAMGHRGTVHYGHVHEPHGIYQVDGVTFSNPGALSRGSLHEHNLTRPVQVACWNPTTGHIQHLSLDAKPAEEVFRLIHAQQAATTKLRLDDFLSGIDAAQLPVTSTEAVLEHIRTLNVSPQVLHLVQTLLTDTSR
jgi:DNA repair exonuclease SbcCD nuclease subunit